MASLISIQAPLDLDIISDIKFSPIQNQLLVSSWDGRVLLLRLFRHWPYLNAYRIPF